MRRTFALTLTLTTAMLLAGCASTATPDADHLPETAAVATASPTPTEDPGETATYGERIINDRGNLVKEIGQLAGTSLSPDSDVTTAQFAVTDIVIDPACTAEFADAPKNGHFVGIHLNVETTPELGNALWCMDTGDLLPADIGPGQSVSGWIVLDLPTDHGWVALTMGAPTGWEWAY